MDLEPPLRDAIDTGWCPHLAMLLRRREEVAPTLASFYALGAQLNGWLFGPHPVHEGSDGGDEGGGAEERGEAQPA